MRWAFARFSNLGASDVQTCILRGPMFRIIAGNARADGLKRGAARALLLASTALATGIFARCYGQSTDRPGFLRRSRTHTG